MLSYTGPRQIQHPLVNLATQLTLYCTEHRSFVLLDKQHLFEIDKSTTLRIIEEVEGLGIRKVVTGNANRVAVLTEGGDVYISEPRSKSFERLDLPTEDSSVRLVGLGSSFMVVVDDTGVWTQGDSEFWQSLAENR
jgi:hypothetical protein